MAEPLIGGYTYPPIINGYFINSETGEAEPSPQQTGPGGGGSSGGISFGDVPAAIYQPPLVAVPIAGFIYTVYENFTVGFRNTSQGSAMAYAWNFGDGQSSSAPNPLHQYLNAGTYNVELIVANSAGQSETIVSVTIPAVPLDEIVGFSSGGGALAVQCTDTSTKPGTREWDFGDGSTSNEINPYHEYDSPGLYTITLTIGGTSATDTFQAYDPSSYAASYYAKFGTGGTGDGGFALVKGVFIDDLYIYVCDSGTSHNRIQIFNKATYAFVGKFGTTGVGDGQFSNPTDIYVDASYIYVADSTQNRIQIFNKTTYAFVGKFGSTGAGNGQFAFAMGISVDDLYIYVGDYNNKRVQIFNKTTYAFVNKFGSAGVGDGQFTTVQGVDVDDSYIYVVDRGGNRIQIFNKTTYAFVGKFGSGGIGDGQFDAPLYVRATDDYIYVADGGGVNGRFQVFNKSTYAFVYKAGSYGSGDGQFAGPNGICVDASYIYAGDPGQSGIGRVQIFSVTDAHVTQPPAPTASITASVASGTAPLTVNFTDASGGSPTSWLWEFGDGATSAAQNPSHTFTAAGTYSVRLTATNAQGSTSYRMTIVVLEVAVVTPPASGVVIPVGTIPGASLQSLLGKIGYFAVDSDNHQVKIHGLDGAVLKTFGGVGTAAGKFYHPTTCSVAHGRQLLDRVEIIEE